MIERGQFFETASGKVDGISYKLKSKFVYQVLLLDVTEKNKDYTKAHALDSLGSMGWCRFDDVKSALGEAAAKKVIKHFEANIRKMAKP